MQKELKSAFLKASYIPETNLADNIWSALIKRNKRIVYLKLITLSLMGGSSLFGLMPAFKILMANFSQSGFYEYFSLAFSSSGTLIIYWKDFLLLLAESLPAMSMILFLTLILVFLFSLKYITRQIIKGQLSLSL